MLRALSLAAGYGGIGLACIALPTLGSDTVLTWLPNGIALAALYRWGRRYAPVVFVVSLLLLYGANASLGLDDVGVAMGSTLGPLAGAWMLYALRFDRHLEQRRDLAVLLAAGAVAATVSTSVGFLATLVAGPAFKTSPGWEFAIWWQGDAIGYLIPGALLLALDAAAHARIRAHAVEFAAAIALTLATSLIALVDFHVGTVHLAGAAFVVLIPLTWLALRFGIIGASAAAAIVSFCAMWGTAIGVSQFVRPDTHESLALTWAFVLTLTLVALTVTVVQAERLRVERALRESEAHYRNLTDRVPAGVYRARARSDGTVWYDYASPRFLAMLDLAPLPADNVRERMLARIVPEDLPRFLAAAGVARGGSAFEWEGRFLVGDELRWVRIHASQPPGDAVDMSWVGVVTDITERKRDELRLRGEQSVLEALARGHPLADVLERLVLGLEAQFPGMMGSVMLLDVAGRRLRSATAPHLPPAWTAAIDGIEIGAAVGSFGSAAFLREIVVVADIAQSPLWAAWRDAALEHGLRACWALPVLSSTGDVYGTLAFYYREPRGVTPAELIVAQRAAWLAALAIERDRVVGVLTESESRYRLLYNRTPAMLMSISIDGSIERVSDFWLATMGYSREEVIGRPLELFIAPEMRRHFREVALPDFLATGGRFNMEARYVRKDGSVLDGLVSTVAVRALDGRILHSLSIVVDISDRKRAERLRVAEQNVFERLTRGEPIDRVLLAMMASYEHLFPGMRCAMLRITNDGAHLGHPLAPSLPADYLAALDGLAIADGNCACGTAAATKVPAVCRDVASDPRWAAARDLAARHDIGSCWSFPLLSSRGVVLGTFSQTYAEPREPGAEELAMIQRGASIATLAIERDLTIAELRRSEERYRAIYNRTPAMQHVIGMDSRIVQVSDYWLETMGYERSDVLGRSIDDFLTRESRRHRSETVKAAAVRDGFVKDVDFQMVRRDGSVMDVLLSSTAERDAAGAIVRFYAVFRDVTDRKRAEAALMESERRLAGIVELAMDAIITCDAAQRIVVFNAAAEHVFRCPAAAAIGTTIERFIPREARARHAEHLRAFGDRGDQGRQKVGARRLSAVRADGELFPIEASISLLEIGGDPLFTVIVRDVTETVQAEATRARLETQLREAQKMEAIGTLAGGIAHDFNNIIGAIVGNVDLALHDLPADHAAAESLESIARSSRRARDLIEQILTFSRHEEPRREPLDVGAAVGDALTLLRATLPASVKITTRLPGQPVHALADSTQLQQVLINLGTNAWQALEGKPGEIEIAVDETTLDAAAAHDAGIALAGRYAHIAVRDTGVGMSDAMRERIFEPFFTTKPAGKGTGLGLAVVHGIVHAHGGGIVCASAPGMGATFDVYLPASDLHPAPGPVVPSALPAKPGRGRKVLYIDDDEALVYLARRLLERSGYRVSAHVDAAQGIAALRDDPASFTLVVTDFSMPGMSGLDVARAVRAIRADLPVLVTTGYVTDELKQDATDAGVREIVYKPDTAAQLVGAVERLIHELETPV